MGYFDLFPGRFHLETGFAFDDDKVFCFASGVIGAGWRDQGTCRANVDVISIGNIVVLPLNEGHSPDLDVNGRSTFLPGVCVLRFAQSQICFCEIQTGGLDCSDGFVVGFREVAGSIINGIRIGSIDGGCSVISFLH